MLNGRPCKALFTRLLESWREDADKTPQGAVRNGDLTMTPPTLENTLNIRRLNDLAFRGLTDMFDKDSGLFCYRLKREGAGLTREGLSPRYTVMTLLGLHRLETAGVPSPDPGNIAHRISHNVQMGRFYH